MTEPPSTDPPAPTSPSAPALPSTVVVTELTNEHTTYLNTFQTDFDTFYATPNARIRGMQKKWVIKNVLGKFQDKFGRCSEAVLMVCTPNLIHEIS